MALLPVIEWLQELIFGFWNIKFWPFDWTLDIILTNCRCLLLLWLAELLTYFIMHWSCLNHLHVSFARNEYWLCTFGGLYQIVLSLEHLLPMSRHCIFRDFKWSLVDWVVQIRKISALLLSRVVYSVFVFDNDVLLWLLVSRTPFFSAFTTAHVSISSFLIYRLIDFMNRHLSLSLWWSLALWFSDIITLAVDRWIMKISIIDQGIFLGLIQLFLQTIHMIVSGRGIFVLFRFFGCSYLTVSL